MAARCKVGDLAVVIEGVPRSNLGRIVKVVKLLNARCSCGGPVWVVEGNLESANPLGGLFIELLGLAPAVADCCLRPIRPQPDDAVDEILQLVGAPEGLVGMPAEVSHG